MQQQQELRELKDKKLTTQQQREQIQQLDALIKQKEMDLHDQEFYLNSLHHRTAEQLSATRASANALRNQISENMNVDEQSLLDHHEDELQRLRGERQRQIQRMDAGWRETGAAQAMQQHQQMQDIINNVAQTNHHHSTAGSSSTLHHSVADRLYSIPPRTASAIPVSPSEISTSSASSVSPSPTQQPLSSSNNNIHHPLPLSLEQYQQNIARHQRNLQEKKKDFAKQREQIQKRMKELRTMRTECNRTR